MRCLQCICHSENGSIFRYFVTYNGMTTARSDRFRRSLGNRMDDFYERLIVRAATIDELLSDDFEALLGQSGDAAIAAERLAAWCRSSSSGDWSLFNRRLNRDGLSIDHVLAKFATVRRKASVPKPSWVDDAIWIEAAMQSMPDSVDAVSTRSQTDPRAFEHLFRSVIERAEALLWAGIGGRAFDNMNESARACLRDALLDQLCSLSSLALYDAFLEAMKSGEKPEYSTEPKHAHSTTRYDRFIAEMRIGGLRRLFSEKPVLLRLIACVTRQWIDTWREFVARLDVDLAMIRQDILHSNTHGKISKIEGGISDPHNRGHTVQIVTFEDGGRVVYKPKDLWLDAAWHSLIARLNLADAPVALRTARSVARDGYGWTEFIAHLGCSDQTGVGRFFRRAGAWLALFHCFAATDMHQENMIASGEYPVPIDLEMILQATSEEGRSRDVEGGAFEVAMDTVANSVLMVGLLPAYGRSPDNQVFSMGGMISDRNAKPKIGWKNINSDSMRPWTWMEVEESVPNLPHVDGLYAKFGDHIDNFVSGFRDYAQFLLRYTGENKQCEMFSDFAGLSVRKIIRPTRFYYMLLQRLKDHQNMNDGATWAAQLDFIARLADWDKESDFLWPLQRAERSALAELNVPHFVSPSDGHEICDSTGISVHMKSASGIERARSRVRSFNEQDILWQIEIIRQNTIAVSVSAGRSVPGMENRRSLRSDVSVAPTPHIFVAEADKIAGELANRAIRKGPGAAWIGSDWLGDSEVSQLVPLGPDLYNGVCGIAVFLAAHANATGHEAAGELARAAISSLRKKLKGGNSARMARTLGLGGAMGLGSIVYALVVISKCLHDTELLADAHVAAELITDDLIAGDKRLDVISGSAGGILGLLRLYRDTRSDDVLKRAAKCGDHLLGKSRIGAEGRRSWSWGEQGSASQALNGMSHGAAGFAYALASLSAATGREEFAKAASECIAFENSSFDAERTNWPDLRGGSEPSWRCQWCHGAPGIGLARIATARRGRLDADALMADVQKALAGVERGWPHPVDTLCCGTLGSIEFLCEASDALVRPDLRDLASRRLLSVLETARSTGDYRWNTGDRRFNLGLFRGLAGIGYTLLRQVDGSLPNVLIWE
jgi:type 2 lantibiotic biosynthesis protein LanM